MGEMRRGTLGVMTNRGQYSSFKSFLVSTICRLLPVSFSFRSASVSISPKSWSESISNDFESTAFEPHDPLKEIDEGLGKVSV